MVRGVRVAALGVVATGAHGFVGGRALAPNHVVAPTTTARPSTYLEQLDTCALNDLDASHCADDGTPPFSKILAANRAEIAVRIMRAGTELDMATVGVYAFEDRNSAHRWCADQSFLLPKGTTPVAAYLDPRAIVDIAVREGAEAVHPGYGFLSESPELARLCEEAGVAFVGPTVKNLLDFSDKVSARKMAVAAGVPVVPGAPAASLLSDASSNAHPPFL